MGNGVKTYFDNWAWHFDDAYDAYSKYFQDKHNKAYAEWQATDKYYSFIEYCPEAEKAVRKQAALHIGMYMGWIISTGLKGTCIKKNVQLTWKVCEIGR